MTDWDVKTTIGKDDKFEPYLIKVELGHKSYITGRSYILHVVSARTVSECPVCGKLMMSGMSEDGSDFRSWQGDNNNDELQLDFQRWIYDSPEVWYCNSCIENDVAAFQCALCEQVRPVNQIEVRLGGPRRKRFLCKPCYASVSAREWDAKIKELERTIVNENIAENQRNRC